MKEEPRPSNQDVDTSRHAAYNQTVDDYLLLNDVLFRIVFGGEGSSRILRAFLNAVMGLTGGERIVDLDILKTEPDKENVIQKGVVLDVVARDRRSQVFDIEVQLSYRPALMKRSLYYLSRLAGRELQRGADYRELPKLVGIYLLDFIQYPKREKLHSVYRLCEWEAQEQVYDVLELHYLEVAKFWEKRPHHLATPLEKWLHVLKFGELYRRNDSEVPEVLEQEEGIVMALDAMRAALAKEEVQVWMALRDKAINDEVTSLNYARDEGREEGRVLGHREVAHRMLAEGIDRATVLKITGLAEDDLC